jgi:hypothetical protein
MLWIGGQYAVMMVTVRERLVVPGRNRILRSLHYRFGEEAERVWRIWSVKRRVLVVRDRQSDKTYLCM